MPYAFSQPEFQDVAWLVSAEKLDFLTSTTIFSVLFSRGGICSLTKLYMLELTTTNNSIANEIVMTYYMMMMRSSADFQTSTLSSSVLESFAKTRGYH